jgi:hypothetical protein
VAAGVLGAAAFGAAAAAGQGLRAVAHGAWMAPALVVGGAVLAAPPLYLFASLAGGRIPAGRLVTSTSRALGSVAAALVGLAAPAAYFSSTLHASFARPMLVLTLVIVGAGGVFAVAHHANPGGGTERLKIATAVWCVFALALGVRLIDVVGKAGGVWGG